MPDRSAVLQQIQQSTGLTLLDLLAAHPHLARRTIRRWLSQCWLSQWVEAHRMSAIGEGRARRYFPPSARATEAPAPADRFPPHIPLSTVELIEHGRAATGKAALETQMILNHKTAIKLLVENIETLGFNRYTLMNLHSALAENLLPNLSDEGRIRQHAVGIGPSVYRPIDGAPLINDILDELLVEVNRIRDPFEQSFFMMVHLPYLQPFADINKRTSRLAANLPLFRDNLAP